MAPPPSDDGSSVEHRLPKHVRHRARFLIFFVTLIFNTSMYVTTFPVWPCVAYGILQYIEYYHYSTSLQI